MGSQGWSGVIPGFSEWSFGIHRDGAESSKCVLSGFLRFGIHRDGAGWCWFLVQQIFGIKSFRVRNGTGSSWWFFKQILRIWDPQEWSRMVPVFIEQTLEDEGVWDP